MRKIKTFFTLFLLGISFCCVYSQDVTNNVNGTYSLENEVSGLKILVRDGMPVQDSFYLSNKQVLPIVTDAGFGISICWTGWRAPGRDNNADNRVDYSAKDFAITKVTASDDKKHPSVTILSKAKEAPFYLMMIYSLDPGKTYFRRSFFICDSIYERHFLDKVSPADMLLKKYPAGSEDNGFRIDKEGGFGQPVALAAAYSGMFAGLENPAATNTCLVTDKNTYRLASSYYPGKIITKEWSEPETVVIGLTQDIYIRNGFMKYVDDIKVHPSEPYILYNSWYDLRSPLYPRTADTNHMNQENVMKIIRLFNQNMTEKYGITLDAFVLDDGWDIYKSDWELNTETFPDGFKPVSDELKKTGTRLGLWLGPTGGYSFRMERINWMKEHGYETVGTEFDYNEAMLCIAGKKYSALFEKRIKDFVKNDKVGYFKWDGIQFSCSEPDHGHASGPYSLAACTESVIQKCKAVRDLDPSMYLNITSGTWLSPWWLKYASQLWMDGEDYAYSESPYIFDRDGAITYRDNVLYDDFNKKKLWFPISNLMTHGIIKGNLEQLGGERDPLDIFTNDVVMYLGRGISMWELYISPDLLSDGEWKALSEGIRWAKDRKTILANTVMIGGCPANGDPYGYAHFDGEKGIIVLRNPGILPRMYKLTFDPTYGLPLNADSLILEKTYPSRLIAPKLFKTNESTMIPVDGYETVVLEIYPVGSSQEPLIAGVNFDLVPAEKNMFNYSYYHEMKGARVMNPWLIKNIRYQGVEYPADSVPASRKDIFKLINYDPVVMKDSVITINVNLDVRAYGSEIGIILDAGSDDAVLPQISFFSGDQKLESFVKKEKNNWGWYLTPVNSGQNNLTAVIRHPDPKKRWKGKVEVWLITRHRQETESIEIEMKNKVKPRISLPRPYPHGELYWHTRIGSVSIK